MKEFEAKVRLNEENGGKTGELDIMSPPPFDKGYFNGVTFGITFKEPVFEAEKKSGWIPCSERLPEEGVNHLGWIERDSWVDGDDYPTRKQEIAIGWHIEGRWHFDGCNGKTKCIAWMPLPEPYKEGDPE